MSEIVSRTGAKRRAVQLWADGGVLESTRPTDRAGTGVHRLFPDHEVQIAALLVPLANMGVPIGILRQFADIVRPYIQVMPWLTEAAWADSKFEAPFKKLGAGMRRAATGVGENFLCFAYSTEYLWISMKSDDEGPVCINPRLDFPKMPVQSRPVIIVLDVTDLLGSLFAE